MRQYSSFGWLFLPLISLLALGFALFVERSGLTTNEGNPQLEFLEPISDDQLKIEDKNLKIECLVLYDSQGLEGLRLSQSIVNTLDLMRVRYQLVDISETKQFQLDNFETIIIGFINLDQISEQILEIMDWVENGGRILFAIRPDPSVTFSAIYRKLGIQTTNNDFSEVKSIKFLTDLLPGSKGVIYKDFIYSSSLIIQLEEDAHVHVISANEYELPLLWDYNQEKGRIVFINSDQFLEKYDRGLICAAYSLLHEFIVYPVINTSFFFIDDFPAPIPAGNDPLIMKQFGRDLNSFFINIWWPDMKSLARKYNIRYTGVIIELYNDQLAAPFPRNTNVETFQYFGNSLLEAGGEIGLHGYNHVPLCTSEMPLEDYPSWTSTGAMQSAIQELIQFSDSLFQGQTLRVYVPPSNILCKPARLWLPKVIPDLKIISSVYLPDIEYPNAYVQNYEEATDGIIELPRITAGLMVDDFMKWVASNEIILHYTNSHFVHPDDVLDANRNFGKGWTQLRSDLDSYLLWLYSSAPGIRNMTASEAAKAVQRYYRLKVDDELIGLNYSIHLDNFYDEAWLLLRSEYQPKTIDGGELQNVATNLYLLKATQDQIKIEFEE
jgi:hypothetical protein